MKALIDTNDAMILDSAIINECDIFCSNDKKAFVNSGKREALERLFPIKIYTSEDIEMKMGHTQL